MNRIALLLVLAFLLPSITGASAHNTLLPRPQKIQYGKGNIPLNSLVIRMGTQASEEDLFAARELSSYLSTRSGTSILVVQQPGAGRAIVLQRTGDVDPLPVPDEHPGPGAREAYTLKVTRGGAEIRARSSAGVFYGVQTLRQLVEGESGSAALPELEIEDWPSLAYRGTMVDVSHGPLPTEDEVKRQLDLLARWKANQYYLYNEASIELDGYSLLNPKGRFAQAQVKGIIAYGRERHIDVVPCLELYGHLHDLFRVERYTDLAVFPHGGEFNPGHPKLMALLTGWAEQFARLFPSPFVHIGFDETWQIENLAKQGAGLTPAKLFVQQLKNVAGLFEQRGKRVMAWADVMVHYPEIISDLPANIIAVPWTYDPQKDYKPWIGPLVEHHVPYLFAPGVRSWGEIAPDFDLTFANIDAFLAAGRPANALGMINTLWADEAQLLMRMSWPGMAYGAVASWQPMPVDRTAFLENYGRLTYPSAVAAQVTPALEKLTQAELHLQKLLGQETMPALWQDPLNPAFQQSLPKHREDLRQTRLLAEEATEHLDHALSLGGDPATLTSFVVGSRLLDYAGMKFLYALEIQERWHTLGPRPSSQQWWNEFDSEVIDQNHGRIIDLMEFITELREDYRNAWLAEYTPYRLGVALGRWDAEYEYWRKLQERFRAFSRHRKEGDPLPSLESVIQGK